MVALLNWLHNDSEQSKEILQAVTGLQVAREILNRLTGQHQIDKCKGLIRRLREVWIFHSSVIGEDNSVDFVLVGRDSTPSGYGSC
ncbi:hypothetical protein NDU88_004245 [Pleurodeles waltl]|uniref:Uncharacterized protein n=1 Tax=Pleurodeles waltl TaxID=8319 RepID=A0AAV7MWY2_PLEWA|nr:hypothetical protein NDU88_004245 [Pleurodeles waltl]